MLIIGKTYEDGWGRQHTIAGIAREYTEYVWATSGFWFRQKDGKKVFYDPEDGHYVNEQPCVWDLKEEVIHVSAESEALAFKIPIHQPRISK